MACKRRTSTSKKRKLTKEQTRAIKTRAENSVRRNEEKCIRQRPDPETLQYGQILKTGQDYESREETGRRGGSAIQQKGGQGDREERTGPPSKNPKKNTFHLYLHGQWDGHDSKVSLGRGGKKKNSYQKIRFIVSLESDRRGNDDCNVLEQVPFDVQKKKEA